MKDEDGRETRRRGEGAMGRKGDAAMGNRAMGRLADGAMRRRVSLSPCRPFPLLPFSPSPRTPFRLQPSAVSPSKTRGGQLPRSSRRDTLLPPQHLQLAIPPPTPCL